MNQKYINALIFIAILVVGTLLVFLPGNKTGTITASPDSLSFYISEEEQVTILFADMQEVTYVENADFGSPLTGTTEKRMRLGRWTSDQFGEYIACASTKLSDAISIRTSDTTYVITMSGKEDTAALYEALLKVLPER